jgi:hypothetical protein
MTKKLRTLWLIWGSLSFVALSGTILYEISSRPDIATLKLRPDESINLRLFRIYQDYLKVEMEFTTKDWKKRPELGDFQQTSSRPTGNYLEFINPGEPIKLLVQVDGNVTVYEAQPTSSYTGTRIYRDFFPLVNDGNPNRFQWPPDLKLGCFLNPGFTTVTISVIEVGKTITDEQANIIIKAPISFKSFNQNYEFIWWFFLWPFYFLFLFWYGIVLRRLSKKCLCSSKE